MNKNNNIFLYFLEQANSNSKTYNIGIITDNNIIYFIAHDGGLTDDQNNAFIFTNDEAIKLKAKEFIDTYKKLGYNNIVYIYKPEHENTPKEE